MKNRFRPTSVQRSSVCTVVFVIALVFSFIGCGGGSGSSTNPVQSVAATPVVSPAAGTYTSAQSVTLSDSTTGAVIYYTTDGSTPATSSSVYSTAIAISKTTTIKAIATASGYTQSAVVSATFTIQEPTAATPTFSPDGTCSSSAQTVTIADTTTGATIYYTTDGSTPTTSSSVYSTALSLSATTTLKAIATASGYTQSSVASATYTIGTVVPVSVVITSADSVHKLEAQAAQQFCAGTALTATPTIVVDEAQTYQQVEGFGADITDTAGYLLNEVAPTTARDSVMGDLFTRNGNGIGLSFIRNPMGSTDLARTMYSYDDNSGNADTTLANFSISHDQADILPLTLQARTLNPSLKIMANPWSPPGWMKTNGTMIGQYNGGTDGTLLTTMYTPFTNYFVKYLQAYAAGGVNVDYISLQNEPLYAATTYPGMLMPATTQTTVLRDYILPALTSAGLNTKVLIYDHNWDTTSYSQTVLSDSTIAASNQVAGIAWHGYGGTPGAMTLLHNQFPTFAEYMTEHSGGTWVTNQGQSDFEEITQVMRNWSKAYVKWSLAENESLGPHYNGCSTCTAPITVNSTTGAITYNIEYYTLGQFSKYVLPGATRLYSSNATGLISTFYQNPDSSKALVVFNDTTSTQSFQIQWGGQLLSYSLPTYTAATFTWNGSQSSVAAINAKSQIAASSYSSVSGFETETTSDVNGGFDLGYSTSGSTAVFKNVDFGTGVSGVNVRLACNQSEGTCGGTVEFHLDSATGTLAASATVPSTSGWQTWSTVTGTLSGTVSGVHDVYVVVTATNSGTNSVANLNWFQFN